MTVTFAPESGPTVAFALTDVTGGRSAELYATYDEAGNALLTFRETTDVLPGCTDPEYVQMFRDSISIAALTSEDMAGEVVPSINVSNINARLVLDALGYGDSYGDLCGSIHADDLLGRVDTALALAPQDAGRPVMAFDGHGEPTNDVDAMRVVDCGRRPGYLQDRLHEIREVAMWGIERARKISWG